MNFAHQPFGIRKVEPNVHEEAFPFSSEYGIKASHAGDVASLSYIAKKCRTKSPFLPLICLQCLVS